MNIWNALPFARLLIAFLCGILLAINTEYLNHISWLFPIFSLFTAFIFLKINNTVYQFKYLLGIPLLCFFLFTGIKLVELHEEINYPNHFSKIAGSTYLLKISEPPKNKAKTIKINAEVIAVRYNHTWLKSSGKLLVYVNKDSNSVKLQYGDIIVSKSKIIDCPPPRNPFEFNYKKYLGFHQLYQQTYLTDKNWYFTGHRQENPILSLSYRLRNYLLNIISKSGISGDEYAVGSALILGYEDQLSTEVIGAFAATGALHVLSVSGLHVGIVFLVINFFLKFLGESKQARISIFIVSISCLWLYALITGMSPSVWRAAAMFSLISLGKLIRRDVNTFNIIACSAFILLCINPFMITEVGFQLSYLAVIGIVGLYPKLYELIEVRNKWLDKIWSISCVSVAAQLVTFPLGLLYFHQFPNYFIFSNLVIIPLSTLILYAGIALLAVSKITVLGAITGKLLYYLLWLLNETVSLFENLPYAIIEGISITTMDTFMIYGILILLFVYVEHKKVVHLQLALGVSIVFVFFQMSEKIEQQNQQKIVVYAVNKLNAIDFISGNSSFLFADEALINDKDKMRFHILPNKINMGISSAFQVVNVAGKNVGNEKIYQEGIYHFFQGHVIANTANAQFNFKELRYVPDIVILNSLNYKNFNALFNLFPLGAYICDGSISQEFFAKIKVNHPNLNIRSVLEEGAITIDI